MNDETLAMLLSLEVQTLGTDLLEGLGSALEGLVKQAEGLSGVQGALANVGASLGTIGLAAVGTGVAITGAITALAGMAGDFDAKMVEIRNNTTMTDADAQTMRDTVMSLGVQGGASLDQLAQGFMHASNFGFSAADSATIVDSAMKSALSTGGDLANTTEILSAALHEFKIPASDAASTMDMLHLAAAEGNMTLEQFMGSAGPVFAWAAAIGVPLDQASAAFATMTRHGFDAAEAGTQVKDLFEHIIKPTSGATDAVNALAKASGMDLTDALSATNLQARGLPGVLDELHSAMDAAGLSTAQQTAEWMQLIPNIRGGAAAFVLTGQGTQDLKDILGDLNTQTGVTEEAWARYKETLPYQWDVLKNQVQETAMTLGEAFLPAVQSVMASVIPLVDSIRDWIDTHATLVAQIAEGVATFLLVAGTITTVMGAVLLLTSVLDPLVLAIGVVVAVAADLASSWGVSWQTVSDTASRAISWVQQAMDDLQVTVEAVTTVAGTLLGNLGLTTTNVSSTITGGFATVESGLGGLSASFTNILGGILTTVNSFGPAIHDALSWLNPYAEHSPSLVSQVNDGVTEIIAAYVSTGQIAGPLGDTGAAIAQFATMGKSALTSLADTTKSQVEELKGSLDELKAALAAAKSDLSMWSSTPIEGTKAFEDQKFSLDQQKEAIQLQIDQAELAGADDKSLAPLKKQLADLGLQASIVDLQEKLKLDPLKRQIQDLANTKTEKPFADIVKGITDAKANIATLTPAVASAQHAYDLLNATLGEQNKALQEIAANTKAASAAAGGGGGGGKGGGFPAPPAIPKDVIQSVKDYNAAMTTGLHDIGTQHQFAAEQADTDANKTADHAARVQESVGIITSALQTIQPVIDTVISFFASLRASVETDLTAVQGVVQTVIAFLSPFIQSEINQVTNWWINHFDLINQTTNTIMNAVRNLISSILTDITNRWSSFTTSVQNIVGGGNNTVNVLFQTAMTALQQLLQAAWDIIQIVIDTTIHDILDLLTITMDAINGNWADAWTTAQDMISTTFTAMTVIVEREINLMIGFINDLIGAWNAIHLSIPGFSIALPSVTVAGQTVGGGNLTWGGFSESTTQIPPIPTLDSGGIVSSPTLALLAANSRPEAIVPLSAMSPGFGSGSGTTILQVNINGAQLFGSMTESDIAYIGDKLSRYLNSQFALYGQHA